MAIREREIANYVTGLSEEEFNVLRGVVEARESKMDAIALMKLPLSERRRIMERQAKEAAQEWTQDDLIPAVGDVIDYD